jgi:D-cysteine desulfhydrase
VLTIGGEGSTHVLSTAEHAAALGVEAHAIRWRHEMHEVSHKVAARSRERASVVDHALAPIAMLRAMAARRSVSRYIPLGGTSPLGMLGHVNAGLELAEQVARGEMPAPNAVVVPLGSGGTAAGLALGFRIASLGTLLVAARVGPLIAANRWRVLALASRAARLIERVSGERVPRVRARDVRVVHDVYGGAYGRVLPRAASGADIARRALGLTLDDTYSAKAFTAALDLARTTRGVTLFWSTFDGRWMYEG